MAAGKQNQSEPRVEDVLGAVERITASHPFAQSARLARFLRFIVERTLEGRSEEIKELVLATEVFDRGTDFDPRESTIVRTEARRLRQRLEDYYRTEGRDDPIQIELPKGSYVPAIRQRSVPAPASRKRTLRAMSWARTALALLLAGLATAACWSAWRRYGPLFPTREATFAVMPFQELSGEAAEDYIAFAARGEMLWSMNRIQGMRTVAIAEDQVRTNGGAAAVGKRFQATHVVEGAARRSANHIRIRARAIELRTGRTIWEGDTTGPVSQMLRWSGAMVLELARDCGFRVSRQERWEASEARADQPPDALLHFWKGAHLLGGGGPGGVAAAASELQRAATINPNLSAAWDRLAYCYYQLARSGDLPVAEAGAKADEAAGRAVAMAPELSYGTKGMVSAMLLWKWEEAGWELKRKIELDPNSAAGYAAYADYYLRPLGRWKEAHEAIDRALARDPANRRLHVIRATIFLDAGQAREAVAAAEGALAIGPSAQVDFVLLRAKALSGDYDGALALCLKHSAHLDAAWVHALAGRRAECRREMAKAPLSDAGGQTYLRAAVHAALGEERVALGYLEQAFRRREVPLAYLNVDPRFSRLRPHPRFQALVRTIGLSRRAAP